MKQFVVVGGEEQRQYDRIEEGSLVFSPDSHRVAYVVRQLEKRHWVGFVVVDGQEGEYEIEETSLIFSPDSQRLAYVARSGGKRFVVVNGQEGEEYDRIEEGSLVFSPDSQRVAYVAVDIARRWGFIKVGESHMVVIDEQEGGQYDGILAPPEGAGIIFDSPNQLHYMARKSDGFYLVEERLA